MKGATHWAFLAGPVTVAVNAVLLWPLLGQQISHKATAQLVTMLALASLLAPVLSVGSHMYVLRGGATLSQQRLTLLLLAVMAAVSAGAAILAIRLPSAHYFYAGASSAAFLVAQASMRAGLRPLRFALMTLGCQTIGLAIAGVGSMFLGLPGACFGYAMSVWLCIVVLALPRRWPKGPSLRMTVSSALSYGFPLVPGLVLYLMIPQGSRLLVGLAGSTTQLLIFQYASLLTLGGVTLVTSASAHFGSAAMGAATEQSAYRYLNQMAVALRISAVGLLVLIPFFLVLAGPQWLPASLPLREWQWLAVAMLPIVPMQAASDVIDYRVLVGGRTTSLLAPAASGALAGAFVFFVATTAVPAHWAGALGVNAAVLARLAALIFFVNVRNERFA